MGRTPRPRSQGQKSWYPRKGFITRNTHVKYQSSSIHWSKVISKVKVSQRMTEWRNDRMTDRTKTICPPIFDLGGIKTHSWFILIYTAYKLCKTILLLCFFFLILSEIPVDLTPVVNEKESSRFAIRVDSTSCTYASELRKDLQEHKRTIVKKMWCSDYDVLEGNISDRHVTILCRFLKKTDLKTFEESFYGNHLAKTLEHFFRSIGLAWRLGANSASKKEFFLRVFINKKHFIQKPSEAHSDQVSYRYVSLQFIYSDKKINRNLKFIPFLSRPHQYLFKYWATLITYCYWFLVVVHCPAFALISN